LLVKLNIAPEMPRNELFIGSLPRDVQRRDIESAFDKYGRIERCDIKNRGWYDTFSGKEVRNPDP